MILEDVITLINEISDDVIDHHLIPVCKLIIESEQVTGSSYLNNAADRQDGFLKKLYDDTGTTLKATVEEVNQKVHTLSQAVKRKKLDVDQLSEELEQKRRHYQNEAQRLDGIKQQVELYENKTKHLQTLRDTIKTYKLLTGTNFAYRKNVVSGYTKQDEQFEVFDFNKVNISDEEIEKRLWDLVEKVANEGEALKG